MKIFMWKVPKLSLFKKTIVNVLIFGVLLTLVAFTYAGSSLQVFNNKNTANAIYHGNTSSNKVSLMINIYWGDEFIMPMLDILKQNNIKTTFFVGGVWANKHADLLTTMLADGHELANHGYYHKDQDKISNESSYNEINQTHQLVKSLTGISMNLFAPPSGAYNANTINIAESLGYKTIMWTRDTIDWRDQDKNLILSRAIKDAKGGDLILMHPTAKTLETLPEIISNLQNLGLKITTVTDTLA